MIILRWNLITKAALITILVIAVHGCGDPTDVEQQIFDGEQALQHVRNQLSNGPRIPGSEGHRSTGNYIRNTLKKNGWKVSEQTFLFNGIEARNIYGVAGPDDGIWILLGAHYDTRPIADRDTQFPEQPVPGANDGASGVAVLLELSRILIPSTLDAHIWLTFFDVEDSGGIDENAWAFGSLKFSESLDRYPDAVVIVDMVGDADLNIFFEANSDPELSAVIWSIAQGQGFSGFIPELGRSILDDHTAFLRLGIPAIDIIDFDYPYWHTTEDTLDKVSAESLEQVGRTLQIWLTEND